MKYDICIVYNQHVTHFFYCEIYQKKKKKMKEKIKSTFDDKYLCFKILKIIKKKIVVIV